MKTFVAVNDRKVSIELNRFAVRVYNDDNEITKLLGQDGKTSNVILVKNIKVAYFELFNQEFKVSDASMSIEILGHVYVEKFARSVKSFIPVKLVNKVMDKIISHCQEIDIGERGHDNNRFVWDLLAPFNSIISKLIFFKQR